jgi:putative DNA primase/helicase
MGAWRRLRRGEKCQVCGNANQWCGVLGGEGGGAGLVRCMETGGAPVPGWAVHKAQDRHGGTQYRPASSDPSTYQRSPEELAQEKAEAEARRRDSIARAKRVWKRARERQGSQNHPRMRAYFEARGIPLDRLPGGQVPAWLRFDPAHAFTWGKDAQGRHVPALELPCIVGGMAREEQLEPGQPKRFTITAVQRIFLDPQAPRKYVAPGDDEPAKKGLGAMAGAVLQLLGKDERHGVLVLCEGIETGLGILAACRRPDGTYPAVWPAMSTSGLTGFEMPRGCTGEEGWVRRVVIAADLDRTKRNGRAPGEDAARICANRLRVQFPGLRVDIALPRHEVAPELVDQEGQLIGDTKGVDWLDVLVKHGPEAVLEGVLGAAAGDGGGGQDGGGDDAAGDEGDQERPEHVVAETRMGRALQVLRRRWAPAPQRRAGSSWLLRRYGGEWWVYVEPERGVPRWKMADSETVRAAAMYELDSMVELKRHQLRPFCPSGREVEATLEAGINLTHVMGQMPCWLPASFDGQGDPITSSVIRFGDEESEGPIAPGDVIAFRNGLLDVEAFVEGRVELQPVTPRWFSRTCLPYTLPAERLAAVLEDEADAEELVQELAPTWLRFLEDVAGGIENWCEVLQRWFGYCLTSDISLQRILWLQGYPGSGKGTIREALTTVVGADNVAMTNIDSLAGRFDLATMVGKSVVFLPEVRVGQFTNQSAALDRLNSISGGDPQKIEDKFKRAEGFVRMCGKFVITPNEESTLNDPSAALLRRLVVLQMGAPPARPDPTLQKRITSEGLGLVVWSLLGLRKLRQAIARGVQPFPETEQGRTLLTEMRRGMSHVWGFVEDTCILQPGSSVRTEVLYKIFEKWCEEQGHRPGSMQTFGRQLRAAFHQVDKKSVSRGGAKWRAYTGLRPLVHGESREQPRPACEIETADQLEAGGGIPFA